MLDVDLLRSTLISKGFTLKKLADKIGMDRSTLYRKICRDTITLRDVDIIVRLLSLNEQEGVAIFFAQKGA